MSWVERQHCRARRDVGLRSGAAIAFVQGLVLSVPGRKHAGSDLTAGSWLTAGGWHGGHRQRIVLGLLRTDQTLGMCRSCVFIEQTQAGDAQARWMESVHLGQE